MQKKLIAPLSFVIATLSAIFVSFASIPNFIAVKSVSPTTEWVHYNKVDASETLMGIKEYWVNCNTHEHLFQKPTGEVTIREGGTPSREFINSLSLDDDRLIYQYTKLFNFDDNHNSFIKIHDHFNSLTIVDGEGIRGSKALKATYNGTSYADAHLTIDKSYLDYVFSDPDVKSLSFYAKGTIVTNNFRHIAVDQSYVDNNSRIIACYEANSTGYGITNEYKQFYLTRGVYSQMSNTDWFIQYGGTGVRDLYLDQFSISYTDYYDYTSNSFENGYVQIESNGYSRDFRHPSNTQADLIINPGNTNNNVSFDYENVTDGYRSIRIDKTTSDTVKYYLRGNFAYNNIPEEGIYFDFYSTVRLNGWWADSTTGAFTDGNDKPIVSEVDKTIENDMWHTFHFTKSQINSNGCFLQHKSPVGTMYIDNIRFANKSLTSFEYAGSFYTPAFSTNAGDGGGGASKNIYPSTGTAFEQCIFTNSFIVASKWKVITAAEITDEKASDGFYSLKLTKKSGGTLEFCDEYISMLGEDDLLSFDIYGENLNRLTATTMGGNTLTIKNGEWTTISLAKNDFGTANKSFRASEDAFGAGVIYIDNIRISHYVSSIKNAGVIHHATNEGITLPTSYTIDRFNSISIDGNSAFYLGNETDNVDIDPTGISDNIIHLANVSYYHDSRLINEYIYFESISFSSANSALNVSASYGDSSYYTLSGYSNVYRMMVGDLEFPYEFTGSAYYLPKAALVQLLPEENNQKVSGQIKLKIFTKTAKYIVPINITLTNSVTVKPLPNYQGEGISTHAYSSTISLVSRTDYEQYFNQNRIAEFQNTGLDIMYEQAIGIGKYEYTLSDAMTYLFNNAAILNQKVMVVDLAFTVLSKYNTSIIGTNLLDNVDKDGNPTGNKFSNTYIPSYDGNYRFASTNDLDAFVEHRLKLYMDFESCYGVNVGDEQNYQMLNGGFKDLMASIHRVLAKLDRQDFYVNANIQPLTATDFVLTGQNPSGTVSDKQHAANYVTYLNAFKNNSGLDFIQFDAYPFASSDKGGIYEGKGLNRKYMENILIVADFCKNNNLDMYMVTQSVTYYGTRILNRSDIAWINNMIMGMGVKHISYFVYCVRSATGSETWIDNSAYLGVNGERTDLYYYYQAQLAEIRNFAPVISCFDYQWCHLYKYSSGYNSSTIYTNFTGSSYYSTSSTYGELTSVTTTADWTLATGLKNSDDGKYMYMVQNVYNNMDKNKIQTIRVNFNKTCQYAVIYESGLPRVVTMNSSQIEIKLSTGKAAYILVY